MLRVYALRELFEAVATLAAGVRVAGDRLTILTNGGGIGVLATDALADHGGRLATLSPAHDREARPAAAADLVARQPGRHPRRCRRRALCRRRCKALLEDPELDALLVLNCPTGVADSLEAAQAVAETVPPRPRVPGADLLARRHGERRGAQACSPRASCPTYETPDEAVRAFMHLVATGATRTS